LDEASLGSRSETAGVEPEAEVEEELGMAFPEWRVRTNGRTRISCPIVAAAAVFACILLLGCTSVGSLGDSGGRGYSFSDKVVVAYYYVWFTKGWFNGSEGNAGHALADIHPLLGAYDSNNPHVIEEHIKMAQRAKIDAFAVSWWCDKPESDIRNRTLDLVFQKAAAQNFKVTIDLEADGMSIEAITNCLRYYLNRYSHHRAVLKMEGKPVLLIWGSGTHPPQQWQQIFDALDKEGLHAFYLTSGQLDSRYLGPFTSLELYTAVDVNDRDLPAGYRWCRRRTDEYNQSHADRPAQWHATIMPGFDEREIPGRKEGPGGAGWKDRVAGKYYRMIFDAALASNPDWIHITSFNELAEHTHIEPTREFGWFYIDMTAKLVDEFKKTKR
jgi:hypothetical protein